jgi:predicted MPP superfamily phosphohydrolase
MHYEAILMYGFQYAVVGVYLAAAAALVWIVVERGGLVPVLKPKLLVRIRLAVLLLAAFGTLFIAWGYVEPHWPAVTRATVATSKLAPGTRPIRIAHISDTHCDPEPLLEERLPDLIAAERPDLIVFTGDALNESESLAVFLRLMTRLDRVAPTFAVHGNWDVWYWHWKDLYQDTGVRLLNGDGELVDVAGAKLWISGVAVESEDKIDRALAGAPEGAFTVFLHHYPDQIYEIAKRRVDLYCAGHTHGGQVALPFYGAIITLSKFGKRFENGLYRVDDTWMYVNRGIGMEGGPQPRVRFCARPEITIIELTSDAGIR